MNTVRLMSECDVLYMPQPFNRARSRRFAELSFPNKMCTYVPTRRPIALHAPIGASLWQFFDHYKCGPTSSHLDADELLNGIEQAVTDPAQYQQYVSQVDAAFREELNEECMADNVKSFLSIQQ